MKTSSAITCSGQNHGDIISFMPILLCKAKAKIQFAYSKDKICHKYRIKIVETRFIVKSNQKF